MPPPVGITAITTAEAPGIFGDMLFLDLVGVEGAPDYSSAVSGQRITLTIGLTSGLTNIDWAAIATLFNADPTVNGLATMDGQPGDNTAPEQLGPGAFDGGSDGLGAGQFYAASPVVPPAQLEIALIFCGVIRYLVRDSSAKAVG